MESEKVANGRSLFKNRPRFQFKNFKTYIIPTSFGFVFAFFCLILLFVALGYNNNLVYLFVFATISLALAATHATNENVRKVKIFSVQECGEYFAETDAKLVLDVANAKKTASFQVKVESDGVHGILDTVEALSRDQKTVGWRPAGRGVVTNFNLQISSEFPFSFLRAWKVCKLPTQIYVYPKPYGQAEFPALNGAKNHLSEVGLFRELRPYRDFDSIRRIDWRASQRHQSLLIRSFEDQKPVPQFIFDWESTAHLGSNDEARLSQLCLWLCRARALEAQCCLVLPHFESGWGEGTLHFKKCLTALSLFSNLAPTVAVDPQVHETRTA